MSEDPWRGLSAGSIDARRVSREGRQDFFWIMSGTGEPGLLLRISDDADRPEQLPQLRCLDIAIRQVDGTPALLIVLTDSEQRELFAGLCADIIRAGEAAVNGNDALTRSISRLMRWHHLLRGGGDRLSVEEQRGLVGELHFLSRLVELVGSRAAIEAWRGPSGGAKDFELQGALVEVKSRRGAARPFVQISSEFQLADVPGTKLFLAVTTVDSAVVPEGLTLDDHVRASEQQFTSSDTTSAMLWQDAIAAAGYDHDDNYTDRRWVVGSTVDHLVSDGFPRIVPPLASGVSSVRYSVSLEACSEFVMDEGNLDQVIREGASL